MYIFAPTLYQLLAKQLPFLYSNHANMGRGGVEVCSVPCSRRVAGSNPPQGVYLVPCSRRVVGSNRPQAAARRVGTLGKSFTRNCSCVKLRFSVRAVVGSASE